MELLAFGFNFIITLVQAYLSLKIVLTISKTDYQKLQISFNIIILGLYYTASFYLSKLFLDDYSMVSIVAVVYFSIAFLIFRFIYRQSWPGAIVLTIIYYFTTLLSELLTQVIAQIIMRFEDWRDYSFLLRLAATGFLLIMALVLHCVQKVSGRIHINKQMDKVYIVYLLFAMAFASSNIVLFHDGFSFNPAQINLYNTILILLFVGFSIYNTFKVNDDALKKQQIEMAKLYAQSLESSLENLRGFKHDLANILDSVNGFVLLNNMPDLQAYLRTLNLNILKISTTDIVNNYLKDCPVLYGLILSKLSLAESSNVEFHVTVRSEKIAFPYVNLLDVSRIIGVLLDNAFEEASCTENGFVTLTIDDYASRHKITILNSWRKLADIDEIFEKNFTTKQGHAGYGLYSVKKIIDDYAHNGTEICFETSFNKCSFKQIIVL